MCTQVKCKKIIEKVQNNGKHKFLMKIKIGWNV